MLLLCVLLAAEEPSSLPMPEEIAEATGDGEAPRSPMAVLEDAGISIHAFGRYNAGFTSNRNSFTDAAPRGDFDHAEVSLNVGATLPMNLRIASQITVSTNNDDPTIALDYAFAEWTFSRYAKLRVGRAPHAFGSYSEIFRVGNAPATKHLRRLRHHSGRHARRGAHWRCRAGQTRMAPELRRIRWRDRLAKPTRCRGRRDQRWYPAQRAEHTSGGPRPPGTSRRRALDPGNTCRRIALWRRRLRGSRA